MKYTIPAIDQRAALALGDIDLIDCHLLQWLFYFCNSQSPNIERNEYGSWVSYEHMAVEMPLLDLQRQAISRRMKVLQEKSYISVYTNQGIRKTYIRPLVKTERLFGDEPVNVKRPAKSQSMQIDWPVNAEGKASQSALTDQYHKSLTTKNNSKIIEKEAAKDQHGVYSPTKELLRQYMVDKKTGATTLAFPEWKAQRETSHIEAVESTQKPKTGKVPRSTGKTKLEPQMSLTQHEMREALSFNYSLPVGDGYGRSVDRVGKIGSPA